MDRFTNDQIRELTDWLQEIEEFVFLDCSRQGEGESLLFLDPVDWLCCRNSDDPQEFLAEAERYRQQGFYLAGWFQYEFGYLLEPRLHRCLDTDREACLAVLGVFRAPAPLVPIPGNVPGSRQKSFTIEAIQPSMDREEFIQALEKIRQYILAGDTYQVNFTFRLDFRHHGSSAALYRTLRRNQSVGYGGWIRYQGEEIMSFSPELFFRAHGDTVEVRPMKGTWKRGHTLEEDRLRRRQLQEDEKCRSENIMIVDLLRNDLGHLLHSRGGGQVRPVSLFDVEVYETLLQMTSTIRGTCASDTTLGLADLFAALYPCGSVTGAPKIRTMEIIHELEKNRRGVYCGAIGYASRERTVFNVPIRTLVLRGDKGYMGIGAGIVHDSEPESEWRECLLKGEFLSRFQPEFQLIETLLWRPGSGYLLLQEHLDRLQESAEFFLFAWNRSEVLERLEALAASFAEQPVRVRLLLHKKGQIETTAQEISEGGDPCLEPRCLEEPVIRVDFSSVRTDPGDRYLYHKTTNRELYDREYRQAVQQGLGEIFFRNIRGEVTEGCISNIFILHPDEKVLLTPPVSSGLLPGTLRQVLLEQGKAREAVLGPEDLQAARAVFMGNSVRGLVQVRLP